MEKWPQENRTLLTRLRHFLFGLNIQEQAICRINISEIQMQLQKENYEENRLFDIWFHENKHRLPKRDFWLTEAMTERITIPYMEEKHFQEFAAYKRTNWSL